MKKYYCDICEKNIYDSTDKVRGLQGVCLEGEAGWGSKRDMDRFAHMFCDDCYDELVEYLKTKAKTKGTKK